MFITKLYTNTILKILINEKCSLFEIEEGTILFI